MKKIIKGISVTVLSALLVVGCGQTSTTPTASTIGKQLVMEDGTVNEEPIKEAAAGIASEGSSLAQFSPMQEGESIAIMQTSKGDIAFRFFPELAPKGVENFLGLAEKGYYDGLKFHRVIDGFMAQGGDPNGDGTGGSSIYGDKFEDEVTAELHHYRGALAYANSGPNTNGSQFYIVQNNNLDDNTKSNLEAMKERQDEVISQEGVEPQIRVKDILPTEVIDKYLEVGGTPMLDGSYTIFGQVIEGMEVIDAITAVEVVANGGGEVSKPKEDIIINKVIVTKFE